MKKILESALSVTLLAAVILYTSIGYQRVYLFRLGIHPSVLQSNSLSDRLSAVTLLPMSLFAPFAYLGLLFSCLASIIWFVLAFRRVLRPCRLLYVVTRRNLRQLKSFLGSSMPRRLYLVSYSLLLLCALFGVFVHLTNDVLAQASSQADQFLADVYAKQAPLSSQIVIEGSNEKVILVACGSQSCAGLSSNNYEVVYLTSNLEKITARGVGLGKKTAVLVFQRDAKRGDRLSMSVLAHRDVPSSRAPVNAIDPNDVEKFVGRRLVRDVPRGQGIALDDLFPAAADRK